jgi:hypothetical protein
MRVRGLLRRSRLSRATRACAVLLTLLALCPYTAPFATLPGTTIASDTVTSAASGIDDPSQKAVSVPINLLGVTECGFATEARRVLYSAGVDPLPSLFVVLRI